MLTRLLGCLAAAALLTAGLTVLRQPAALAGSGPGGGGTFGSVACGQAFTPSCAVSAGSGGTTTVSAGARQGRQDGTAPPGGGSPSGCAGTVSSQFGCVPAGCQVTVATLVCPLGFPGPAPGVLAQLARRYLVLPGPVIRSSPAPGDLQLVRLPVWLWVSRAMWAPRSKTASVPGEAVTATATPVAVTWRMGDGSAVTCHGPGIPYTSADNPASPSPDCGHVYTRSSAGQPGGAYRVTATITWDITWTAAGGAGGALPPLYSAATAAFRVAESQAVNTAGGQA